MTPPLADQCWVLTDGKAGMEAQALGLAEAVGLPIVNKRLRGGFPWRFFPAKVWPPGIVGLSPRSDRLEPPWPRLVVSCGRHAVGPAMAVKRKSGGRTVAVHIQHPRVSPRRFDLIAAPIHDRLTGPNVEVTTGSVHRVTRAKLDAAAAAMADDLADLPRPRVAVLIGGSNGVYRLDPETVRDLGGRIAAMAKAEGASLLVTPSRRTGAENVAALERAFADVPGRVWDLTGENPYFAWLGAADAVLVTGDSVNMVSEAGATGKPVYLLDLPVEGNPRKFERFHRTMIEAGALRPFAGRLEDWTPTPVDDTQRVAARVRALLDRQAEAAGG